MRVNLAFKILRQKVRKSPRQYFATKVRKLRFQILKTEVCKSRHIPDICHERCERRACKIFG